MAEPKLEPTIEQLVAYKRITSPSGSLSDRAKARMDEAAQIVYSMLKKRESVEHIGERVRAKVEWKDREVAKGMKLGIEEFKQKRPEQGEELQKTIDQHRTSRRAYLEFGLNEEDLSIDFYIEVLKNLGIKNENVAVNLYRSLREFAEKVARKKDTGSYSMILPE